MLTPKLIPPPPAAVGDTASQLQAAWEKESPQIVATAILLAKRGDITAIRLILERIAPVARGRAFPIENLPRLESLADVPRIHAYLVALVAGGILAAEEADAMSRVLERYVSSVEATDTTARIAAIEQRLDEASASR